MVLATAIRLAEEAQGTHENTIPGQPIHYGVAAFVVLCLLLFITTRFNADR